MDRAKGTPQPAIPIDCLDFDSDNPRLGGALLKKPQTEVMKHLVSEFDIDELVASLLTHGYFDEEPLVVVPAKQKGRYTVIEGNRRLAALKRILGGDIEHASADQRRQIEKVPVIVYARREDVFPYMGVRHIVGVKEWDSYPKARYINERINAGRSLAQVTEEIGDPHRTVERLYETYKVLEEAESAGEFDREDTAKGRLFFSYLLTAIGNRHYRRFLDLPEKVVTKGHHVPTGKRKELKEVMLYLYGSRKLSKSPAVRESRQIGMLGEVLNEKRAVIALRGGSTLEEAHELTKDEEERLIEILIRASQDLDRGFSVAVRHPGSAEAKKWAKQCHDTATRLANLYPEQ